MCDLYHEQARLEPDLLIRPTVPIIEFNDATGTRWRVWSTLPYYTTGLTGPMQQGWLTFESGDDRRRLAPIPDGWERASDEQLRAFCSRAERLTRTPITGTFRVEPRDR